MSSSNQQFGSAAPNTNMQPFPSQPVSDDRPYTQHLQQPPAFAMSLSHQQFGSAAPNISMQPTQSHRVDDRPRPSRPHQPLQQPTFDTSLSQQLSDTAASSTIMHSDQSHFISDYRPRPRPRQLPQPGSAHTHSRPMASAGNMAGYAGATHHGANSGGYSTDQTASRVAATGSGLSMQTHLQHTGPVVTNGTTSAPLHAANTAAYAAAAAQQGLIPPPARPTQASRIMTFQEIAAIATPNIQRQPPSATRIPAIGPPEITRPPNQYLLRNKVPTQTSVEDSAMIHFMIATGFLADPHPHYLYDEERDLARWYKGELVKILNVLLELDNSRRSTGPMAIFKSIDKNSQRKSRYPHQGLLKWIRTGLRKGIDFREHADWVQLLLTYTEELKIYDLMTLITRAYHRVHSGVPVDTVTYAAPSNIGALRSAKAAQQHHAPAQRRNAPVQRQQGRAQQLQAPAQRSQAPVPRSAPGFVAPSTSVPLSGTSFGATMTGAPSSIAAPLTAPPSHANTRNNTPQTLTPSASTAQQPHLNRVKRNVSQGVRRRSSGTQSQAGTPALGVRHVLSQPLDMRGANAVDTHNAMVMNKPRKRHAEEEVEEFVRPPKTSRQERYSAPDGTSPFLTVMYENQGKRKADEEVDDEAQSPKRMRNDIVAPPQSSIPDADFQDFSDVDFSDFQLERLREGASIPDIPLPDLEAFYSEENIRMPEVFGSGVPATHNAPVPNSDCRELPETSTPLSPVELYMSELREKKWTEDDLWAQGMEYRPLPPDTGTENLLQALELAVSEGEEFPPLFREMPSPEKNDFTELARFIRFAQSHSQLDIDWRVNRYHCDMMNYLTNKYGRELLRNRNSVGSQEFENVDWFAEHRADRVMVFAKFAGTTMDLTAANIELVYRMLEDQELGTLDAGPLGRDIVEHVKAGGTIPKELMAYLGLGFLAP